MKDKLKTLKDIDAVKSHVLTNDGFFISEEKLKAEAIKWVKEEIKNNEEEEREMYLVGQEQIERWMDRFNITREDLK